MLGFVPQPKLHSLKAIAFVQSVKLGASDRSYLQPSKSSYANYLISILRSS
ncbi:hypothetical protein [Calothrix sp. NIES-2098]|uniref:hypothetical protein n=1 Tax=Calothrix sp. NIES-2098 TaxID=1954171 RepID=UPI0030D96D2B